MKTFFRDWALPLSMGVGAGAYFLFVNIPGHQKVVPLMNNLLAILQPLLIFLMLFVTFCKIRLSDLRFHRWHLWLVLAQTVPFTLLLLGATLVEAPDLRAIIEAAALCLICPTATAAAVVTGKLGGNTAMVVSYTILVNMAVAILVPVVVPFCHSHAGMDFWGSLGLIMAKVFPLLIFPLILAQLVRRFLPKLLETILRYPDLAFHLWVVALALAIAATVKSVVHSQVSVWCQVGIAAVSLVCCLLQFAFGRFIGRRHGHTVTGGQAMGQKNTVFAIWMGFTFLTPVTAVAGGFYSVWHNLINARQLYKASHIDKKSANPVK